MLRSIGIDIVDVTRIERDLARFADRFVNRILGQREREQYDARTDKKQFLAGRLAGKEAVIKALGVYLQKRPALNQIQIVNDEAGQPHLFLADEVELSTGNARCMISITHEKKMAAAVAMFVEEE